MRRFVVAFVLLALSALPGAARGPEVLTPELKQHLASLSPLRTGDQAVFGDKPVLVKFWASW